MLKYLKNSSDWSIYDDNMKYRHFWKISFCVMVNVPRQSIFQRNMKKKILQKNNFWTVRVVEPLTRLMSFSLYWIHQTLQLRLYNVHSARAWGTGLYGLSNRKIWTYNMDYQSQNMDQNMDYHPNMDKIWTKKCQNMD